MVHKAYKYVEDEHRIGTQIQLNIDLETNDKCVMLKIILDFNTKKQALEHFEKTKKKKNFN